MVSLIGPFHLESNIVLRLDSKGYFLENSFQQTVLWGGIVIIETIPSHQQSNYCIESSFYLPPPPKKTGYGPTCGEHIGERVSNRKGDRNLNRYIETQQRHTKI